MEEEILEFPGAVQRRGIEYDMIMDMGFISVGGADSPHNPVVPRDSWRCFCPC